MYLDETLSKQHGESSPSSPIGEMVQRGGDGPAYPFQNSGVNYGNRYDRAVLLKAWHRSSRPPYFPPIDQDLHEIGP